MKREEPTAAAVGAAEPKTAAPTLQHTEDTLCIFPMLIIAIEIIIIIIAIVIIAVVIIAIVIIAIVINSYL